MVIIRLLEKRILTSRKVSTYHATETDEHNPTLIILIFKIELKSHHKWYQITFRSPEIRAKLFQSYVRGQSRRLMLYGIYDITTPILATENETES